MADGNPVQNLCEETTCSVCLEYFKDPVIIDCGHVFCQACITRAWGEPGRDASCPQCREPCQQRNFRPIRQLSSIVEIAKKFSLQMARGAEALGKVCERHQEPLKLFCEDDRAAICVVCDKSKDHREHKVIPKEEAFEAYQGKIRGHLEFLNKRKKEILASKLSGEAESQNLLKRAELERQKIVANFKQLHQFLEEQERCLLAQLKELGDGIKSYWDQHIAKLSKEMSSIDDLIKELEEKQKQPVTEFFQDIRNILQRCHENKAMGPIAFPPGYKKRIEKFSKMHPFLETAMTKFQDIVHSGPQEKKGEDTAMPKLVLSLYSTMPWGSYRGPNELLCCSYVMGVERIASGTHSWVAEMGGEKFWAVGVANVTLRGCTIASLNAGLGIWAIVRTPAGNYYPSTAPGISLGPFPQFSNTICKLEKFQTKRIRVCVNYKKRLVTFSDADSHSIIFTFTDAVFSEEGVCSWLGVGQ
ncbi:zinc finger protein RFP-like [Zootoca vivipara]|uniref:zinc finger protein RFP-like n=1 Tax=Zootoca vivipara TaxID=8524 RepID=UPI001591BB0D|nr:zinc finger protein RFP-like [Zootoca vivipara]